MKKHIRILLLAGILLLVLAACGQLDAPDGSPAPTPGADPAEGAPSAVLPASPAPEQLHAYLGTIHPPLPEGLTEGFGMLIQDAQDHSLTFVVDGEARMLWLNKLDHYDPDGSAFWEVKDVLDLSTLEAGLVLIPDGCFLNGVPDSEIFVAGKDGTVHMAWRANTTLDRFEVLPTTGIECQSDKAMDLS